MIEQKIKKIFLILNLLLVAFGFLAIKHQYFQNIDDFFYSKLFKANVDKNYIKGLKEIALVKIDKKFFSNEGVTLSTFHRGYYAKLVQKLKEYGVKNIVFDVFFQDLKYGNGKNKAQKIYKKSIEYFDNKFANQINNKIILGVIPGENGPELPAYKFVKKGAWLGYVKSHINKNDINDGVYPYETLSGEKIITLGYISYLNKLFQEKKINSYNISIVQNKGFFQQLFQIPYLKIDNGKKIIKEIPLSIDNKKTKFVATPLFIRNKIPNSYSLYDIIHDEDNIYADKFKNKVVFVGATDETLNDIKLSYIGIIPGVIFHINNFLAINSNNFLYILPTGQSFIILLIIFLIGYFLVVLFKNEKITFFVFFLFLFTIFISSYFLFLYGVLFPLGTIIILTTLKLIIDIIHILFINQEKRKFLTNLFDRYVGNKVREEKEKQSKLAITTQKKEVAMMFSDIASFTNISETLKPEEVGKMLNSYFEVCTKYIRESGGRVDKYIGDAIMAYWEDIEKTDLILDSVINIQKSHPYIMEKIEEKLGKKIKLNTRIGLHFGEAIVGDIGDINFKVEKTAIGDNVNLASRLEGINKYYSTNIIISENFYNKIKNKDNFLIRLIDKITVKGKTEPVKIYEPIFYLENSEDSKNYIKKFELGLKEYFDGNFEKAQNIFDELLILNIGKKDPVLKIFLERIEFLKINKPENWDGVWKYSTK